MTFVGHRFVLQIPPRFHLDATRDSREITNCFAHTEKAKSIPYMSWIMCTFPSCKGVLWINPKNNFNYVLLREGNNLFWIPEIFSCEFSTQFLISQTE